jgi:hypothetical protein
MKTKTHSVTPEKAMEILKMHGTVVTLQEAEIILKFMRKYVEIALSSVCGDYDIKIKTKTD